MPETQARENFDYFMRVRLERLEILRGWMHGNFGFGLTFEPESACRLNSWMRSYGAFLIDKRAESYGVFVSYQPPWVDQYASYNVMFDIGIYLGEYVIFKRPNVHWIMDEGDPTQPDTLHTICYRRPVLSGFVGGNAADALGVGLRYPDELRQYVDIGSLPGGRNDKIIEFLKWTLYLAALTPETVKLPIRDLRNERLE
jgi:hypothetical protein